MSSVSCKLSQTSIQHPKQSSWVEQQISLALLIWGYNNNLKIKDKPRGNSETRERCYQVRIHKLDKESWCTESLAKLTCTMKWRGILFKDQCQGQRSTIQTTCVVWQIYTQELDTIARARKSTTSLGLCRYSRACLSKLFEIEMSRSANGRSALSQVKEILKTIHLIDSVQIATNVVSLVCTHKKSPSLEAPMLWEAAVFRRGKFIVNKRSSKGSKTWEVSSRKAQPSSLQMLTSIQHRSNSTSSRCTPPILPSYRVLLLPLTPV